MVILQQSVFFTPAPGKCNNRLVVILCTIGADKDHYIWNHNLTGLPCGYYFTTIMQLF